MLGLAYYDRPIPAPVPVMGAGSCPVWHILA